MNEQYAMMPDKILMDDTLAVTAKHIYLLLDVYYFQTQENDIITLSKAKISEVLNAELKTVTRHIDKLIQRKYIEQIKGTGIGRNNPSKYKLLSRPSKDNGIQFTKIGRNRIFSMPSEILIKYCWIKCLYRKNRGSTNIADYLLAAIESPYKLPGDFINDLELLKDYNFSYELKHKLTIEFSDDEVDEQKEKAQSEDQAKKTHTNNIQKAQKKIASNIELSKFGTPIVKQTNGEIDWNKTYPWLEDGKWNSVNKECTSLENKIESNNRNLKIGLYDDDDDLKQQIIDNLPKLNEKLNELKTARDSIIENYKRDMGVL